MQREHESVARETFAFAGSIGSAYRPTKEKHIQL